MRNAAIHFEIVTGEFNGSASDPVGFCTGMGRVT